MNKSLSIYLDVIRIIAAVAVFIGHAQGFILPGLPRYLASHAQEAVAVFFILSGFVIQYVIMNKDDTWKLYVTARLSRIYSVVPVALIATYAADRIGLLSAHGYYETIPFYSEISFFSLLKALFFGNEIWFTHGVFGSNEAYWSLGFEVPYYLLAGLLAFLPTRRAIPASLLFGLIAGPKLILYSAVWLLGAATYRLVSSDRFSLSLPASTILFVLSIASYAGVRLTLNEIKLPMYEWVGPKENFLSLVYFLSIGGVAAVNIFAFSRMTRARELSLARIERPIRWLAGATFTIYLTHEPLLVMFRALTKGLIPPPLVGVTGLVAVFCLCLVLAELGERRKNLYRNGVTYLLLQLENMVGFLGRRKSPAP